MHPNSALIVGAGPGISTSLARALTAQGTKVALAARRIDKLATLCADTGAQAYVCDATQPGDVSRLFDAVTSAQGAPDLVVYNASARVRGAITELDPQEVAQAIAVTAYGGFLVGQYAAQIMVPAGRGTILFTGASASIKGFRHSAAFAMGKFALRGLAQSMARELHPLGVHVAHFIIDGGVRSDARPDPQDRPDSLLDPDAIAATYLQVVGQPRSAWSFEVELRPWNEIF